ncbi:MAG: hypothetical protein K5770_02365 [Lachnospiraceae bacterium]|nr:hypothetical protein [Lachnospiraceae bacterium]
MKRITNSKKLSVAVITGLLTAGLSVAAFAAPGGFKDGRGQMGPGGFNGAASGQEQTPPERPEFSEMPEGELPEMTEGERPELPEMAEGERPELPEMAEGERPELPEMAEGERPEPPEMPEGEMPKPPAGEQADGQQEPLAECAENRGPGGEKGGMLNTEAVAEAISAIEDEETQTKLSDLLSAYQTALDAEKEALDALKEAEDSDSSDIDIDSLRSAVMEAGEALKAALLEEGITIEFTDRPPVENSFKDRNTEMREEITVNGSIRDTEKDDDPGEVPADARSGIVSEPSETRDGENKGFFAKIKDEISEFFGKNSK